MVTRADVAKKAGVSVSAVSRTMNGRGYVAKEKKQAILEAVKELGYRPNPLSDSLKNKQTFQLCFFNTDISNSFYLEMFGYMSEYALTRGYTVFLLSSFNRERIQGLLMDGMILQSEATALSIQEQFGSELFLPMVSNSYGIPVIHTKNIPYVDVDTYEAMNQAIQYLRSKGHTKIAYATPYGKAEGKTVQSRNVAYENVMRDVYGEHLKEYYIISNESYQHAVFGRERFFEEGIWGADEFHKRNLDATAVICFNDEFALGMMSRLKQLGYEIPHDISIMGFDGVEERKRAAPLLTTMALNIKEQAETSVAVLIDLINGKKTNYFTKVKPFLLEGESVKELTQVTK